MEEQEPPKPINPHLNRGTFKAAEAFISNAPYGAETFFSAFKSIHAPEKGKNSINKKTGKEVYSIENTSKECLTFCRVMALLYNKIDVSYKFNRSSLPNHKRVWIIKDAFDLDQGHILGFSMLNDNSYMSLFDFIFYHMP